MSDCIIWAGRLNCYGYGKIGAVYAHRQAYERAIGPIPDGMVIDHLCRVHACVNPEHLEAVSNAENILRGVSPSALNARKTHCPRGHPYDAQNTYRTPRGRHCRACNHIHVKAYKKKKRAGQ